MRINPLLVFLLILSLAACSSPGGGAFSDAIPVPTVTRGAAAQPESGIASPITAEETVYVFLTAYENTPDEMILFLSPGLRENLPEGGVMELLGFEGTLEGLVFTSGTTATDSRLAIVEASLQFDGVEVRRVFYLEFQDGSWLITAIE